MIARIKMSMENLDERTWSHDHYCAIITKSVTELLPFETKRNKGAYVDEYMKIVTDMDLLNKYGCFLEGNGQNMLTLKSMPWLDFGDLPNTYDKKKSEAF